MTPDEIWLATMGQLQMKLQRNIFDSWLKTARLVSVDAETKAFTIEVRNDYAAEYVRQKLLTVIQEAISKAANLTGVTVEVVARVEAVAPDKNESGQSLVDENRAMAEKIRVLEMRLQQVEAENKIYRENWENPTPDPSPNIVMGITPVMPEGYILVNRAALVQAKDVLMEGVNAKALILMLAGVDPFTGMYRGTAAELAKDMGRKSRTGWKPLVGTMETLIRREGKHIDLRNFVNPQHTFLQTGENVTSQHTFGGEVVSDESAKMSSDSTHFSDENEKVIPQMTNVTSQHTNDSISFFLSEKKKSYGKFGKKEKPPARIIPLLAEMERRLGYRPDFWQPVMVELSEEHIRALIEKAEAEAVKDSRSGKSPAKLMYAMLRNGEMPGAEYFELAQRRMS